ERHQIGSSRRDQPCSSSKNSCNQKRILEGLRILLAEDTPLIQIVACKILEKVGATVSVVPDGLQAVEALNRMLAAESSRRRSLLQGSPSETPDTPRFDLILMDCQTHQEHALRSYRDYKVGNLEVAISPEKF
ncbi:hypothetical protein CUMW_287730, partial [Citrus unshiu]